MKNEYFEYDVGLSFAGEQREYVQQVASELKSRGIRVFFDDYEQDVLWGKDLYAHLSEIYYRMCKYCVIFVSKEYAEKVWPNQERQSAQARALEEKQEYILPARFDDTKVPGLLDTVGYVDLKQTPALRLSELIAQKLGKDLRHHYLPPTVDRLYEILEVEDEDSQRYVRLTASSFFDVLRRLDPDERNAVIHIIRYGCTWDMPEDIHINVDFLRRLTDTPVATLKRLLGSVRSLGFECSMREGDEHEDEMPGETLGNSYFFHLDWHNLGRVMPKFIVEIPSLKVAHAMVWCATEYYFEQHGMEFLGRLDFSQLARVTASKEVELSKD